MVYKLTHNNMEEKKNNNWFIKVMGAIAMVYLLLPSNNASPDAYDYACSAKYGVDLFHPHHLLFNGFFHLEYKILGSIFPSIDVLKMMQATNALFALATLVIAYKALKMICSTVKSQNLIFFCASTFGMLRFATDGETYIIPLFFCLLATLFFVKGIQKENPTFAFWSGLSFAAACLFHQTALFWGIGLWIGYMIGRRMRSLTLFTLASLTIPVVYMLLMPRSEDGHLLPDLFRFMTDYYHSDSAEIQFGWTNIILTPINLFRTIYQVHGNIPVILKGNYGHIVICVIAMIIAIFCLSFCLYSFVADRRIGTHFSMPDLKVVEISHIIAFTLSLLFAFFSHGNAEFMVMLPLCAAFFLHAFIEEESILYGFALSAFLWNVSTAIVPSYQLNYYNEEAIVEHIHNHPQATYLLREKNSVSNKYFYRFGVQPQANLVRADREKSVADLRRENLTKPDMEIYTDVISRPTPLSRGTMLNKDKISCKKIEEALPIPCAMGDYSLDLITFNE